MTRIRHTCFRAAAAGHCAILAGLASTEFIASPCFASPPHTQPAFHAEPMRDMPGEEQQYRCDDHAQVVQNADFATVTFVIGELDRHDLMSIDVDRVALAVEQRAFVAKQDGCVVGNSRADRQDDRRADRAHRTS